MGLLVVYKIIDIFKYIFIYIEGKILNGIFTSIDLGNNTEEPQQVQ